RAPALKEKDPFTYYNIERNFKLSRIPSTDFLGGEEGRGRVSFWFDMMSFIKLAWILRMRSLASADVIYTRDFRLVQFLPKKKVVLEVHDIPPNAARFKKAVASVRHVVVISQGLKATVSELSERQDVVVASDAV